MSYEADRLFETYRNFIDAIDNSLMGSDEYGNLAWHVDCTAQANAADDADTEEEFFRVALETAKMALDDREGFYPQLTLKATDR